MGTEGDSSFADSGPVIESLGVRRRPQKWCSYEVVRKRIPILQWLPLYTLGTLSQDFLAGLTVGLTAIPQGLAYAIVAGLDAQYGLYSGFMGCFVYLFLGSCKDVTIGPTAIMALMVNPYVMEYGADTAVLLCFLSGCIIFLFGVLHLGFLVQFISFPVTSGFTCAAAITIASSQIKSLLGLSVSSNTFLESWINCFKNIKDTKWQDLTLGLISIVILLCFRYLRTIGNRQSNPANTSMQNMLAKVYWLLSLGSNAIVVILGTLIAWLVDENGKNPFKLTGHVKNGLPPFELPPFNSVNDGTEYTFPELMKGIGVGVITIPVIAILESIAIAKSFAKGKSLDATQEMLALGMCNIFGSFLRSMPTTGSFTRTAVNNASGVQTPLGGIFTGALVLMALSFLTSAFCFIPKATLAAVILTAMFFMLEIHAIILLWHTKKLDLVIFIITVVGCLFISLEIGIVVGMAANLVFILYATARPNILFENTMVSNRTVLVVTPSQSLQFPAAEYVREKVMEESDYLVVNGSGSSLEDGAMTVVLDGKNVLYIDATVAKNLKVLADDLDKRKQRLIFWRWPRATQDVCNGLDAQFSTLFIQADSLDLVISEQENRLSRLVQI